MLTRCLITSGGKNKPAGSLRRESGVGLRLKKFQGRKAAENGRTDRAGEEEKIENKILTGGRSARNRPVSIKLRGRSDSETATARDVGFLLIERPAKGKEIKFLLLKARGRDEELVGPVAHKDLPEGKGKNQSYDQALEDQRRKNAQTERGAKRPNKPRVKED